MLGLHARDARDVRAPAVPNNDHGEPEHRFSQAAMCKCALLCLPQCARARCSFHAHETRPPRARAATPTALSAQAVPMDTSAAAALGLRRCTPLLTRAHTLERRCGPVPSPLLKGPSKRMHRYNAYTPAAATSERLQCATIAYNAQQFATM